jgi:phosphonopyruvate decarboxylase
MIKPNEFYSLLKDCGINFFTGVPDSLLKDICAYITDHTSNKNNIIAANEGGAIALASGHHIASGQIPLVYMQNSGIGNAINPLLSLADPEVYCIPMLLLIGWRGEPDVKDEPQHIKQGKVTLPLLASMAIPYLILADNIEQAKKQIGTAISHFKNNNSPFALIVRKGTFDSYKLESVINTNFEMTREEAIRIIVDNLHADDIIISTTGMASRELYEYREQKGQGHEKDFLTVGSMGHASQIALGIALERPSRNVYCFDGDGAVLMHTGSLGIIGNLAPENFKHIVFNNGAHDSVGGQPTIAHEINLTQIAKAFNYTFSMKVSTANELSEALLKIIEIKGPALIEISINKGARKDLGRPTSTPTENKDTFIENLRR